MSPLLSAIPLSFPLSFGDTGIVAYSAVNLVAIQWMECLVDKRYQISVGRSLLRRRVLAGELVNYPLPENYLVSPGFVAYVASG
jgi:hypothetical protein